MLKKEKGPQCRNLRKCANLCAEFIITKIDCKSALTDAHNAGVIDYDQKQYQEIGPCYSLRQVRERVDLTSKEQLFRAMKSEILTSLERKRRK